MIRIPATTQQNLIMSGGEAAVNPPIDKETIDEVLQGSTSAVLDKEQSLRLLDAIGISRERTLIVNTIDEARVAATDIGFPINMENITLYEGDEKQVIENITDKKYHAAGVRPPDACSGSEGGTDTSVSVWRRLLFRHPIQSRPGASGGLRHSNLARDKAVRVCMQHPAGHKNRSIRNSKPGQRLPADKRVYLLRHVETPLGIVFIRAANRKDGYLPCGGKRPQRGRPVRKRCASPVLGSW